MFIKCHLQHCINMRRPIVQRECCLRTQQDGRLEEWHSGIPELDPLGNQYIHRDVTSPTGEHVPQGKWLFTMFGAYIPGCATVLVASCVRQMQITCLIPARQWKPHSEEQKKQPALFWCSKPSWPGPKEPARSFAKRHWSVGELGKYMGYRSRKPEHYLLWMFFIYRILKQNRI